MNPRDRGLAYGDGLFETIRVTAAGVAPLWPRHLARLRRGMAALALPAVPLPRLEQALQDGIGALGGEPGVVKLVLTRGVGGRGYLPPANPVPSLIWQVSALPVWSETQRQQGVALGLCSRPLYPDAFAGHKHLNRLPQVQARMEVDRQGWDEGLLLSSSRQPLEATAMNLFARLDGTWWTPDLTAARAGVAGVMRDWLLDTLRDRGEPVACDLRPLSQLRRADGVFLCNSVVGVLPVRKLAQWQWPVPAAIHELQRLVDTLLSD
ncbi:MAG: aminodeoxychorismate lyase [Pseudomonadales bacterium]|nr:aminodeoxychorismate lyase [Pseudomonadales bacterium]